MQIKRDYSQPFFGTRRRRRVGSRLLFLYGLFMGAFLVVVLTQWNQLQLAALDVVGLAPTATPFASTYATWGSDAYQRGDVDAALGFFEQAAKAQPDNINYLYEYGKLLIDADRADEVLDDSSGESLADHILRLAPQDPRGYALKAKALVWVGQPSDAIPVGVSGLEQNSDFAPLHAALARAYTQIGRYQQGLTHGETAVELDPLDIEAHRAYAIALIFVGQRDDAIAQLEDAVALNPNLTATYFELAGQYLTTDQNEMAIATYDRILSLDPQEAKAYLRLCEAYAKVGQYDRSEDYCNDALDTDPNYAAAWKRVGMDRYNRRNYEGAIEAFEKCISLGSTDIECWYLRGLAHYYLGDCDQAWDILTQSLTMVQSVPDNELLVNNIREGLRLTTVSCTNYVGRALPTVPPPTPIPPTPIGG